MKALILFVDDDRYVLDGYRAVLHDQRNAWEMEFAESVDEALENIAVRMPDAVISDFKMPRKDGFELIKALRALEAGRETPIAIVTGIGEETLKRRALDLGATDLLSKPVAPGDLIARIRNMLQMKEYQDTIREQNLVLEDRIRERTAQLERSRLDILWRLATAGEYRDENTGAHVARVGWFSRRLAQDMGCESDFCHSLFLASPLHDIGKIGIPDRILMKPGPLDEDEWKIMQGHCEIGVRILSQAPQTLSCFSESPSPPEDEVHDVSENPFLEMASRIAGTHHERWDGSGYPRSLKGEDIPLESRIVGLVDVYDALSSDRPYKNAFEDGDVLSIMEDQAKHSFDPAVFAAFKKVLPEFQSIRHQFLDDAPIGPMRG